MDGRRQRRGGLGLVAGVQPISIGIIGGGLVGSLAAISIVTAFRRMQQPVHIDIFERFAADQKNGADGGRIAFQSQYDARNIVLSSATADFFKYIHLWHMVQDIVVPIEYLNIGRCGGRVRSVISAEKEGVPALGYVADMGQLAVQLGQLASGFAEIDYHYGVAMTGLKPMQTGYLASYTVDQGTIAQNLYEKQFHLVIAADGQESWVCDHLNVRAEYQKYKQQALVTNISMDRPMPNRAYEQFIDGGAITLLPLTQSGFPCRMALVWIDAPSRLNQLQKLSDAAFLQQLARHLPLDAVYSEKGRSKIDPLHFQLRQERVRPHLVVIGNAAQSLHPVAAQGFNLAVRDIRDFIAFIGQHDLGRCFSGSMMQQFAQLRLSDVQKVRGFVDVLHKVFFAPKFNPVLGVMQDIALLGFELFPGAKAGLSRFAMGGRGRQGR